MGKRRTDLSKGQSERDKNRETIRVIEAKPTNKEIMKLLEVTRGNMPAMLEVLNGKLLYL